VADSCELTATTFQGFTDPDYASLYITSNDCEMDEGDADNPDKITTQAFASIKVCIVLL